jgi:S1-C subfamily serine protease
MSEKSLLSLSRELGDAVAGAGPSVVRVDDGSRLTASGVIWSADGVIVASSHGVERDEDLAIELADGTRHAATLAGRDPDTDLAVLKIAAGGLPGARKAAAEDVRVGHLVVALGRPGGVDLHATLGIISARFDTEMAGKPGYILHTDAVLYPGFSGGALVDAAGSVVGITNLLFGRGKGVAVGAPVVDQVAETLLAHGRVRRGYLGIMTQPVALPAGLAEKLEPRQERAVLVMQVEPGSPGEQGGLILGDLLIALGGQPMQDTDELRRELRAHAPGQAVALRVLRGGEVRELQVTLGGGA